MKTELYEVDRVPDVPKPIVLGKPAPQKRNAPSRSVLTEWLVVAALNLLSFIPLAAGAFRLTQLAGSAVITPDNARFFASPLPVVIHIMSATVYAILGAFQFSNSFRRRWPGWHRMAGRVVVIGGLLVGLSGLWMTIFYPSPVGDGDLLYALRLLFGSGMVLSIVLGFRAIRKGDVIGHRAWMMRGYAIGLGAGTQALTLLVGGVILGTPDEFSHALLMGSGWVINLAVAEWLLRKRQAKQPAKRARTAVTFNVK